MLSIKRIFFVVVFSFILSNFVFGQTKSLIKKDTTFTLVFDKLKHHGNVKSLINFSFTFKTDNDSVLVICKFYSHWFMLSTSKTDYFMFLTKNQNKKYFNEAETKYDISNDKLTYFLKTTISKAEIKNIFSDDFHKVFFNFSPKPDLEIYLNDIAKKENRKLSNLDKLDIKLSKTDLTTTASKPRKSDLEAIKNWLILN